MIRENYWLNSKGSAIFVSYPDTGLVPGAPVLRSGSIWIGHFLFVEVIMTKVVFKVVKFLELYLVVRIKQQDKKITVDVLDISQILSKAYEKSKFFNFIQGKTSAELKKIIAEKELEGI